MPAEGRARTVAELFSGSTVSREVQRILREAVQARVQEVLDYAASHEADVVVFPEYAIPVACLPLLRDGAAQRAVVAGLGRVRNDEEADLLREAAGALAGQEELVGRNATVLVYRDRVWISTKRHLADSEDAVAGTGPIVETLRFGSREVRLGVAVCRDFLRSEEEVRKARADVVCIPAYTKNVESFRPDAPRDHVRVFANCADYGGTTIMIPDLMGSALGDNIGVRPVSARHEAVVLVEFDRFPARPSLLERSQNRLVLRSEMIEKGTDEYALLGRLRRAVERAGRDGKPSVTELARDAVRPARQRGPLAEGLHELRMSLDQEVHDPALMALASTHLTVSDGNRPVDIRERQAAYVFQQLDHLDPDGGHLPVGAARDLYRTTRSFTPPSFDSDIYISHFLRSLRGRADPLPPVAERYALHSRLTDADITGRIRDVVRLWELQAREGTASLAEVCRQFLEADLSMRAHPGYQDPRWWRAMIETQSPVPGGPIGRTPPSNTGRIQSRPPRRTDRQPGRPQRLGAAGDLRGAQRAQAADAAVQASGRPGQDAPDAAGLSQSADAERPPAVLPALWT